MVHRKIAIHYRKSTSDYAAGLGVLDEWPTSGAESRRCWIKFRSQGTDETSAEGTTGIENEVLADLFVPEPNLEEAFLAPGTACTHG